MSDATDPQLKAALEAAGADMGLQLTAQQVERMLQLHLACEQRIGVIVMGPSGSGKSTLWQVGGCCCAWGVATAPGRDPAVFRSCGAAKKAGSMRAAECDLRCAGERCTR
jgi:ABC-type hemin transport system ATPase subunit